jgi:signal transduction histidine kinase/Tfp pilus assembly protein PilF
MYQRTFRSGIFIAIILQLLLSFDVTGDNPDKKLDSLNTLLISAKDSTKVELLIEISEMYRNNYAGKSLLFAKEAFELADSIDLSNKIPNTLLAIGKSYFSLSEYDLAFEYFNKALEGFAITLDKAGASRALNGIGIIYYIQGDCSDAMIYFNKAVSFLEKSDNIEELAGTYSNIAMVYYGLGQTEKALEYLEKNLKLLEKIKYPNDEIAISLNNMAIVLFEQNDSLNAIDILTRLIDIQKKSTDIAGYINSLSSLGGFYLELKRYNSALECLYTGLKTANKINDNLILSNLYNKIASTYHEMGKNDSSFYYCSLSLNISQKLNLKNYSMVNYKLMSEIYEERQEYGQALNYYKLYKTVSDSVFSENNLKQTWNFQIKYETEQKEKKFELLKKENEIKQLTIDKQKVRMLLLITGLVLLLITLFFLFRFYRTKRKTSRLLEEKNSSLSRSINTKDKLFSIVSHDLKNPVETFYSLSGLLNEKYEILPEESKRELITQIEKSAKNLFYSLDNILLWSISERGLIELSIQKLSLQKIMSEAMLTVASSASRKKITITNTISQDSEIFVDMKTIITVFRNILSNAVKFTREDGRIEIRKTQDKEYVTVIISDNGIGIDNDHLNKIFNSGEYISTTGTSNEKGTGLGLIICKEFLKLNKGFLRIKSDPGHGTEVICGLPCREVS